MATRGEGVERWERSGLIAEKLARHEAYKLYQLYWCRWKLRAYRPSQPLPWSSTEAPRFPPLYDADTAIDDEAGNAAAHRLSYHVAVAHSRGRGRGAPAALAEALRFNPSGSSKPQAS